MKGAGAKVWGILDFGLGILDLLFWVRLRRIRLYWEYESPVGRDNPGHQNKNSRSL